jgi:hypothetical protein
MLVHGIGINDADYAVQPKINGAVVRCKFYVTWSDMLKRSYCKKYQETKPTYAGCSVCSEWLTFSNFKAWMMQQDWKGNQLDKDLLHAGNKIYSPETCSFVDVLINAFLTDSASARGDYLIGCSFDKRSGKFRSYCRNVFTKTQEHLGYFASEQEAHEAWRQRKHELACELAELQTDKRVIDALRTRYLEVQS